MGKINEQESFETELDILLRIDRNLYRLRREMKMHELFGSLRYLIIVGAVCAAWYFRAV